MRDTWSHSNCCCCCCALTKGGGGCNIILLSRLWSLYPGMPKGSTLGNRRKINVKISVFRNMVRRTIPRSSYGIAHRVVISFFFLESWVWHAWGRECRKRGAQVRGPLFSAAPKLRRIIFHTQKSDFEKNWSAQADETIPWPIGRHSTPKIWEKWLKKTKRPILGQDGLSSTVRVPKNESSDGRGGSCWINSNVPVRLSSSSLSQWGTTG